MKLCIGIVTYNSIRHLPVLLQSFKHHTAHNYTLIFYDNGSQDDTLQYLHDNNFGYHIYKSTINRGFVSAHNVLYSYAVENDFTHYLCMNDDIEMTINSLETLINTADTHPEYTLIQPLLMRFDGTIDSSGMCYSRYLRPYEDTIMHSSREIWGVSGACFMACIKDIEHMNANKKYLFDKEIYMYKEDIELNIRINNHHLKAYLEAKSVMYHHRGYKNTTHNIICKAYKKLIEPMNNCKEWSYKSHRYLFYKHKNTLSKADYYRSYAINILEDMWFFVRYNRIWRDVHYKNNIKDR